MLIVSTVEVETMTHSLRKFSKLHKFMNFCVNVFAVHDFAVHVWILNKILANLPYLLCLLTHLFDGAKIKSSLFQQNAYKFNRRRHATRILLTEWQGAFIRRSNTFAGKMSQFGCVLQTVIQFAGVSQMGSRGEPLPAGGHWYLEVL